MTNDAPEGLALRVLRTRVYFDPESGRIVHVHRLVSAEELDDARVEEELAAFDQSLEQRHEAPLDNLDVDDDALQESMRANVTLRVDVDSRRLVTEAKRE
jgi:hypothetical protein